MTENNPPNSNDSNVPHNDESHTGAEWITPRWIWEPLADALGGFDLDPAAGAEPDPIARTRYTGSPVNGLGANWFGHVWLNHPYDRETNPKWSDKLRHELGNPNVDTITALLPASSGTIWYGDAFADADYKTEFHRRIEFSVPDESDDSDDNGASFASVIHTFEVSADVPDDYLRALDTLGEGHPSKDIPTTTWRRVGPETNRVIRDDRLSKHVCSNCDMRFWTVETGTVDVDHCPHCGDDPDAAYRYE